MKVLILEEYYKGNDALQVLVDAVWEGALAAGHEARILEVNDYTLIPCHGCLMCGFDSPCVLSDDMDDLKEKILKADAVVFASSPTDRGLSPQLFALASRFIYFTQELRRKKLRSTGTRTGGFQQAARPLHVPDRAAGAERQGAPPRAGLPDARRSDGYGVPGKGKCPRPGPLIGSLCRKTLFVRIAADKKRFLLLRTAGSDGRRGTNRGILPWPHPYSWESRLPA